MAPTARKAPTTDAQLRGHVEAWRRFNRFYTVQIGVLREGLLDSQFSLTQVRVLYELANSGRCTASALRKTLRLDAGYLSRILARFERDALIRRSPSEADGRQQMLELTRRGESTFAVLDARSSEEIERALGALSESARSRLVGAMRTIEGALGEKGRSPAPYTLRTHRPGDMGWVVHRHGVIYAREYGWNEEFEALVATITADFIRKFDPRHERCWIAERGGECLGSVFVVRHSKTIAKLRLLLVEDHARGMGIGRHLISECVRFAREAGYRSLMLWTNSVLVAARHLYEQAGFALVEQEPHHSFGHDLVGETWELKL